MKQNKIAGNATQKKMWLAGMLLPCCLLFLQSTCSEQGTSKKSSLLWEISGKGLQQPSYIFGSMHLIDAKDFFVRPAFDSALAHCSQVAFEIKLDDLEALMSIQDKLTLPDDQTLDEFTSAENYKKIAEYFKDSLDMDISESGNQKPFVLYQALEESYVRGEQKSYELYFLTQAMSAKKEIFGLESVDDQLNLFDKIPYKEQMQWICNAIDSSVYYKNAFQQAVDAYTREDLNAIGHIMDESSPELNQYDDLLLYDRNAKWVPEIEKLISDKSTFIAVGAAHLPGDKGVLQLLRDQGYTVKPI